MLTEGQIYFVTALVIPILVQVIKLVSLAYGKEISRFWITIIAFVASLLVGWFMLMPKMPTTTDPMEYASQLLVITGSLFGIATAIYNLVIVKIFDAIGISKEALTIKLEERKDDGQVHE